MRDVRFLFLHSGEFDATVMDSQVVDSLVALRAEGVCFDMLVLMHGGPWVRDRAKNRRRRREISDRIEAPVRVVPVPRKTTPLGDWLGAQATRAAVRLGRARRTVIHARADMAAYFAAEAARGRTDVRFVYDARGDGEAEFDHYAHRSSLSKRTLDMMRAGMERHREAAVRRSAHVLCVSTVLRDRLLARYDADPGKFSVIPCVADERKFHADDADRNAMRRRLGVEDKFLVVFPGRFGTWHYGPEMVALVEGLMRAYPDVYFLVLTPDVDRARELAAERLPAGRFDVRSVPHAEVPGYLRAADLGLLLRAPHPLNEVACPTKFAEYMLSGVPVLISAGIGDCSGFVAEHRAGVVLETPDPDAAVRAVAELRKESPEALRHRLAAQLDHFSRRRAAARMATLYRRLASD